MAAIKLNITDTDEDVPRSGRAGLDIPPVLLEAVKASLETGKTKQVTVPAEQADEIKSYLRSIQNRFGYQLTKGSRDGKRAGTKEIFFLCTELIDPSVARKAAREAGRDAAESGSDVQEG